MQTATFTRNFNQTEEDMPSAAEKLWHTPLPGCDWSLPIGKDHHAGFGAKRKHSLHTGVDLYCNHMQPVASVENGKVINITDFSKRKNKSPWLNKTRVILIEGKSGVVAYCNVKERPNLSVGDQITAGEIIGNVIRLNKKKKKKDICMLHIELYSTGTKKRVAWSYLFPKPPQLLDPSKQLLSIITNKNSTVVYRRRNKNKSNGIH